LNFLSHKSILMVKEKYLKWLKKLVTPVSLGIGW